MKRFFISIIVALMLAVICVVLIVIMSRVYLAQFVMRLSEMLTNGYATWQAQDKNGQIDESSWQQFTDWYMHLTNWRAQTENQVFVNWLEAVLKESTFLDYVLKQPNRVFLLNCLTTLFDQVRAINQQNNSLSLADFCHSLETMQQQHLKLNVADLSQKQASLKLCTVHKAKGREWTYVIIVELIDGKWGNNKKRQDWIWPTGMLATEMEIANSEGKDYKEQKNDDERRLFYVALTRAKRQVCLSCPQQVKQNGQLKDKNLSLFVAELLAERPELIHEEQMPEDEVELTDYLTTMLAPAPTQTAAAISAAERAFFAAVVKDFKLSITELNAYLTDVKQFVYQYLLRIPQEKTTTPNLLTLL